MKITNNKLIICMALLHAASYAMQQPHFYNQPDNNNPQEMTTLVQALNTMNRNLAQRNFGDIEPQIAQTQGMLQVLNQQIQPELARRQQAAEFHTVTPIIDALLKMLDKKCNAMQPSLEALHHYDAGLDGGGNAPCAQLTTLSSDVKIALAKLFRIVNQQPFPRNPQTPTFVQCLQQTSLMKKYELCQLAGTCYQRWFANGERPAAQAPADQADQPAAPAHIPGQEDIERWRNFIMDLYMQWLIRLDNIDLLINNLADYLTPDNVHAAGRLQQGQEAMHAAAQQVPVIRENLQRLGEIGHQLDEQLALMATHAGTIEWIQNTAIGGIQTARGIAGGLGSAARGVGRAWGLVNYVIGGAHPADANDAEIEEAAPQPAAAPQAAAPAQEGPAPAAQNAAQPAQQPMNEAQWRQLLQNIQQIVTHILVDLPRNINANLDEHHLNAAGWFNSLEAQLHLIRDMARPFTRDQRLGSPEFRGWLERKAQAWEAAIQQARAAAAAPQPIAGNH